MDRKRRKSDAALLEHAARHADQKIRFGTYITRRLHTRLDTFSDASGIPITRIVSDAVTAYLDGKAWPVPPDREFVENKADYLRLRGAANG